MNNSFARLIDGMCATLRTEVLPRLDDEFARGQVFGLINVLNTFKTRADWSAGFLLEQIAAQQQALDAVRSLFAAAPASTSLPAAPALAALDMPPQLPPPLPPQLPIADLLQRRDEGNAAITAWLQWRDEAGAALDETSAAALEALLRGAMRAEVDIELKHSPRPLFAEMSNGRES